MKGELGNIIKCNISKSYIIQNHTVPKSKKNKQGYIPSMPNYAFESLKVVPWRMIKFSYINLMKNIEIQLNFFWSWLLCSIKNIILNIKQIFLQNFRIFSFVFSKLFCDISHFFIKINIARKKSRKKYATIFAFFAKFRIHLFHEKIRNFLKNDYPIFAGNTRVNLQ